MALAKKCDRCGKLYEHYPPDKKLKANGLRLCYIDEHGNYNSFGPAIDLCPECMKAFNEFMIKGKFGDEQ